MSSVHRVLYAILSYSRVTVEALSTDLGCFCSLIKLAMSWFVRQRRLIHYENTVLILAPFKTGMRGDASEARTSRHYSPRHRWERQ